MNTPTIPEPLFIDGEALVIDKPTGLPVDMPRAGGPSVEELAFDLRFGFATPPMPVHRLDTDTSGCLLLARNRKAHKRFQRAFEEKIVAKTYVAVVEGVPEVEEGTIELSLAKVSTREDGWRMIPAKKGKPSITNWRLLAVENGRAFLEMKPETGRTHQLRVHCADGLGLPILGDERYGGSPHERMMLHAVHLSMPREGKQDVIANAPLPAAFAAAGFALPEE